MTSFEVELKFRVADFENLLGRIQSFGAKAHPSVEQEDGYLSHPSRDFAKTGEAFRVRREGERNRITYKGPKLPGPTKTREEVEVGFADGMTNLAKVRQILGALGFMPVATVRKIRREYECVVDGRLIHVALDQVESLGSFAEVETLASGSEDLPGAQATIQRFAAQLGLSEVEPRSYLRMLLESAENAGKS
jgi:adenylate cyclase class 2